MLKEDVCSDYVELTKIQEKLKDVQAELDVKMQEWEEANEKILANEVWYDNAENGKKCNYCA